MRVLSALLLSSFISLLFITCNDRGGKSADILDEDSASIIESIPELLEAALTQAEKGNGKIDPLLKLNMMEPLLRHYDLSDYQPVWSANMEKKTIADSLMAFIDNGLREGLFPEDYHHEELHLCHRMLKDSTNRRDPELWTRFDLLHSDAFMKLVRDLKQGRLQPDSNSWHHDEKKIKKLFLPVMKWFQDSGSMRSIADSLEPKHAGYRTLKAKLKDYLDSMDASEYTYLEYPWKKNDAVDSLRFMKLLRLRLSEEDVVDSVHTEIDSAGMALLITRFQSKKKWVVSGRVSGSFIRQLNDFGLERFKRLAITLDRYKQLPDSLPEKYIWVNLPEFMLHVWEKDSLLLESKIICGKPATPTPSLNSAISNVVVFPTWTVPLSIVTKETLPALKKNPGYLAKHNMYLLNGKGQRVNADTIKWSRFNKFIPYQVQQGSGEKNALGVIKFNFFNAHDVYLHDTDQRYLFQKSKRALSHGCVRVQEWEKLAFIVVGHDSASRQPPDTLSSYSDSISSWVSRGIKKTIYLRHRLPLFFNYFGCKYQDGTLHFFEDIYDRDKELRDKYFSKQRIIPFLRA
jgi:murein L,D-transpeptidase YcbB/YkuD